jgi:TRAP-type uncharacterized transport system fused permease subunit
MAHTWKHCHPSGSGWLQPAREAGLFRNLAGEAKASFFLVFRFFLTLLKRMNAVQIFVWNVFSIFFEKMGFRGPPRVYKNHI